jgi:hypothetical protein
LHAIAAAVLATMSLPAVADMFVASAASAAGRATAAAARLAAIVTASCGCSAPVAIVVAGFSEIVSFGPGAPARAAA